MYTQLGVMTKGTVIEVNVSELGMVTTGGKVVFGKYAQITNNPENDGCINAVLRMSIIILLLSSADIVLFISGLIGCSSIASHLFLAVSTRCFSYHNIILMMDSFSGGGGGVILY